MITWQEYCKQANSFLTTMDRESEALVSSIGHNRDSTLLDETNWKYVIDQLEKQCGEEDDAENWSGSGWAIVRFTHWACGWIEHIFVKPDSKAASLVQVFEETLEDYPVLDEDGYTQAEWDATWENIRDVVSWNFDYFVEKGLNLEQFGLMSSETKEIAINELTGRVIDWFYDNKQECIESRDDMGGWVEVADIEEALIGLGLLEE